MAYLLWGMPCFVLIVGLILTVEASAEFSVPSRATTSRGSFRRRYSDVLNAMRSSLGRKEIAEDMTTRLFSVVEIALGTLRELAEQTRTATDFLLSAASKSWSIARSCLSTLAGSFILTSRFTTRTAFVPTTIFQTLSCGVFHNRVDSVLRTNWAGVLVSCLSTGTRLFRPHRTNRAV